MHLWIGVMEDTKKNSYYDSSTCFYPLCGPFLVQKWFLHTSLGILKSDCGFSLLSRSDRPMCANDEGEKKNHLCLFKSWLKSLLKVADCQQTIRLHLKLRGFTNVSLCYILSEFNDVMIMCNSWVSLKWQTAR